VARVPLTGPVAVRSSGPGMPGALWWDPRADLRPALLPAAGGRPAL